MTYLLPPARLFLSFPRSESSELPHVHVPEAPTVAAGSRKARMFHRVLIRSASPISPETEDSSGVISVSSRHLSFERRIQRWLRYRPTKRERSNKPPGGPHVYYCDLFF